MHHIFVIQKIFRMIQRIQSVFLFISALFFGSEFALPFATSNVSLTSFLSDLIYNIYDSPILMGITVAGIIVCLIAIFLYKNRGLQSKLSYVSILLSIALPLTAFLLLKNQEMPNITYEISEGLGLFMPVGSLIFSSLAARFIKKDDKLVKSMDRLR